MTDTPTDMLHALSIQNLKSRKLRGFLSKISHLDYGQFTVTLPDGSSIHMRGDQAGPHAHVKLHSMAPIRRLFIGGSVALADSYIDGEWSCSDLETLFTVVLLNEEMFENGFAVGHVGQWINRMMHLLRNNSKKGSKRNIAYHYDLGNAFFKEWLDPTMTYSSALYETNEETLEEAQYNKLAAICDMATLKAGDEVLEIGCGWGGFADYAARNHQAKTHGITLSEEQLAFANERFKSAGIDHLASAHMTDYRDVTGQYDKIVSIEMFEAVGEEHWERYFKTVYDHLKPGGIAVLQVITIEDARFDLYRKNADFIQKYIFPGGFLPSPSKMEEHFSKAGLLFEDQRFFGKSYAKTCRLWAEAFNQAWPKLEPLGFDDRFKRMWDYYLDYCAAGFEFGSIDVGFFKLRRPG